MTYKQRKVTDFLWNTCLIIAFLAVFTGFVQSCTVEADMTGERIFAAPTEDCANLDLKFWFFVWRFPDDYDTYIYHELGPKYVCDDRPIWFEGWEYETHTQICFEWQEMKCDELSTPN